MKFLMTLSFILFSTLATANDKVLMVEIVKNQGDLKVPLEYQQMGGALYNRQDDSKLMMVCMDVVENKDQCQTIGFIKETKNQRVILPKQFKVSLRQLSKVEMEQAAKDDFNTENPKAKFRIWKFPRKDAFAITHAAFADNAYCENHDEDMFCTYTAQASLVTIMGGIIAGGIIGGPVGIAAGVAVFSLVWTGPILLDLIVDGAIYTSIGIEAVVVKTAQGIKNTYRTIKVNNQMKKVSKAVKTLFSPNFESQLVNAQTFEMVLQQLQ